MDRSFVQVISDGLPGKSPRLGRAFRWEHSGAACDAISAVCVNAWARAGVVDVESSPRRTCPAPAAIWHASLRADEWDRLPATRIAGFAACTAVQNPRVPTKDMRRSFQQ